jgi:flavodoxin
MKGIVAYDSVHGNTKQVAEAIADEVKAAGHEVELIFLRESKTSTVQGDFLFIGSPTRAGRMTGEVKTFIENLNVDYWKNKPIVNFDTVGPLSKDVEKRKKWLYIAIEGSKNAAARMRDLCMERGLKNCSRAFHIAVVGFLGPLAPEALEMAKEYTRKFLVSIK